METQAPADFQAYLEWRRIPEGRRWFREALLKDHVGYRCERCGDEVWLPKGDGLGDSMPCPWPCAGVRQRQKPPEWWEEEK